MVIFKKVLNAIILSAILVLLNSSMSTAQNGDHLVFAYKPGDFFDTIQSMVPNATDSQQILFEVPGTNLICPRASANNVLMAFIDSDSGMIHVGGIGTLVHSPIGNSVPAKSLAWSSDGSQIYFWGSDFVFYSIPHTGGATTPLFGGRVFWSWFIDGGFDVFRKATQAGSFKDYILIGATLLQGTKIKLLQLEVKAEAVDPVVVFDGLGDNYTPTRGPLDGKLLFQADHDRAGSHRVYGVDTQGTATALTDLFSGSPAWNPAQTMFAFVRSPSSTFGVTAYAGLVYTRSETTGEIVPQITTGIGRTPSFHGDPILDDN